MRNLDADRDAFRNRARKPDQIDTALARREPFPARDTDQSFVGRIKGNDAFASFGDLAYLDHAVSTTSTATIPACQDGDLGVFLAWGTGGGSTTPAAIATPAGWTSVGSVVWGSGDRHRLQVFAKLLAGSDDGASLTGITGGQASRNTVYVFRGGIPLSSLGSGDFEGVVTSGDPPAVTIACSSATRKAVLAMALRAQRTNETWTPISFSPAETGAHDLLDEGRIQVLWLAFPDNAAADVSADTADSGTGNTFATWYIDVE